MLLDLARTTAIVFLLLGHLSANVENPVIRHWFGWQYTPFPSIDHGTTLANIAVSMFLVISGIALELNYGSREYRYGHFLTCRIIRIYPVYWLALLLGIAVYVLSSTMGLEASPSLSHRAHDLLWSITGFTAFAGKWGGPFVQTSWFIGLIMTLYMLYPFLSKSIKRRPHMTIVFALLLSICSRYTIERWDLLLGSPLKWFPLCQLFTFALGIYLVNVLKADSWLCINKVGRMASVLAFVSGISFPLFLVHYPLLSIVGGADALGISESSAISIWFLASGLASWLILLISERYFSRDRILGMLFRRGQRARGRPAQ